MKLYEVKKQSRRYNIRIEGDYAEPNVELPFASLTELGKALCKEINMDLHSLHDDPISLSEYDQRAFEAQKIVAKAVKTLTGHTPTEFSMPKYRGRSLILNFNAFMNDVIIWPVDDEAD